MNIKPLQNFVLLEELTEESKVGIYIPEGADKESTQQAKVIALGDEVKLKIQVGDTVMFKPFIFDEIVVEKKKYRIGEEKGIFAVIS